MVSHGLTDPAGNNVSGAAAFRAFHRLFRSAFPDLHFVVEDVLIDGDRMAARCRVTGTHSGPGVLPAATNKPVDFTGMLMVRVRDGKIVEGWNNFDFMTLYQQLGLRLH